MKRLTSKPVTILLLFTLLMLFPFFGCYAKPRPKIDKTYELGGLMQEVVVRRDYRSIPYIEAKNEADLYFAQGYETARDRLWQMDLLRRVARGRLAELFGKQVLNEDKRWRRYGFSEIAKESLRVMSPVLRKGLENYSRGVNAYIDGLNEKTLPVEFQILQYKPEKWEPTDTIVIGKILADSLSTTWWMDLNRAALKKLPKRKYESLTNKVTPSDVVLYGKDSENSEREAAYLGGAAGETQELNEFIADAKATRKSSLERIGFYAKRLAASNNWVISGKKTSDGNAILANDPHLRATAPGIWYLTHLSMPGMRVAGVTFPGVPGIVLGHNQHIAWGATNVGPDVQDVYIERFNDKGEYKTPDGWEKARVRTEEISFRPNPLSPKTKSETFEVLETRNGVVFRDQKDGKKLALKWSGRNPKNQEFEAFFGLNRAKNWKDFKKSLKTYGGAAQNFIYADRKGNIGWHVGGNIPVRRKGEGAFPYDGATNDGDWIGSIPFDELPHLYNPESGFIATANQRIVGTDYKYQQMTRQFAGPWRARRIFNRIDKSEKITVEDVADMQFDSYNIPLAKFAKEIIRRKAASTETLKILSAWDGKMTSDSVGATLADQVSRCVGVTIANENKPASQWFLRQSVLPWAIQKNDMLWLPKRFSGWTDVLKYCDGETRKRLAKRFKGEDQSGWKWGAYRVVSFQHPLAAAPLIGGQFKMSFTDVNGSGQTPNVGTNVSMRFIATPGNWDNSRHVLPLGQSGDPQSKHWKDQYESWRDGKAPVFPFSEEAVKAAAKGTVMLKGK